MTFNCLNHLHYLIKGELNCYKAKLITHTFIVFEVLCLLLGKHRRQSIRIVCWKQALERLSQKELFKCLLKSGASLS